MSQSTVTQQELETQLESVIKNANNFYEAGTYRAEDLNSAIRQTAGILLFRLKSNTSTMTEALETVAAFLEKLEAKHGKIW